MLHQEFSEMQMDSWLRCPSDTNAVERKNRESKDSTPLPIQQAMINRYKAEKFTCAKQVADEDEVKTTYHDRSESARHDSAKKRNVQRRSSSENWIKRHSSALQTRHNYISQEKISS
jgi:hypothetical protein